MSGPVRTVVVVAGGPTGPDGVTVPAADVVVAADSGLHHALTLGLTVDVLIGDLDSVDPALVARAGRVVQHPADKDATDLELALDEALRHAPDRVFVVASAGGRLDHAVAGL
ncbi:MAG: thiamine diphosphokinase, partial [Acidimicrobiales bacterium]|nr:thiamine diphosphokinase [Acidimicrobiales bacterium]